MSIFLMFLSLCNKKYFRNRKVLTSFVGTHLNAELYFILQTKTHFREDFNFEFNLVSQRWDFSSKNPTYFKSATDDCRQSHSYLFKSNWNLKPSGALKPGMEGVVFSHVLGTKTPALSGPHRGVMYHHY